METTTETLPTTATPVVTTPEPTPATVTVAIDTTKTTATVPARKSQKGKWGKVGAPPKTIKYPRGAFTIKQLVALNPGVCELTLRNTVTNTVRGFKLVDGVKVEVPVTLVKLPKNAVKETVGRPNFRFMSKAAFDANQNNLKKAVKPVNPTTPATPTAA
jgi:hypothetical protein